MAAIASGHAPARAPGPGAGRVEVRGLPQGGDPRWDRYVEAHPEGTFFHLSAWREVIRRAFGHRGHYLLAEDGTGIAGVLPLVHVRSLLFGNALVSTPFCVYGGVLASSEAAASALRAAATELAERLRVDYLELRGRSPQAPDWPGKDLYVTFRREIAGDEEENLAAVPRKQRAMIRKGIAAGLQSQIDDGIDRFFPAYAASVRNLGTPVFARRYFELLKQTFGERCEILTVTSGGEPVSSVMSFYFRDEVLPYYGGGTAAARGLKANDFMYWELMRRAGARGVRLFDFGRSKQGTGSFSFKKNWGFVPEPLHYQYRLVRASAPPDVNPLNPKYRLFIAAWRRLPLGVANRVGPMIARGLG